MFFPCTFLSQSEKILVTVTEYREQLNSSNKTLAGFVLQKFREYERVFVVSNLSTRSVGQKTHSAGSSDERTPTNSCVELHMDF